MNEGKRKIGEYTVLCSVNVGEKEVILASNEQSTNGDKFMCGFAERNDLFELCSECMVMSVPDVMRILGLGKTATYRLINQCRFKTYLVLGKMRVDVDSFEDWYAGQFHYEKVNGERPGKKYGKTLSPLTVAKVLGIPRSTANDLMNDGIVEFIWVDGKRRIKRESFDKWYASQSKYTKVKEIEEVEGYVD